MADPNFFDQFDAPQATPAAPASQPTGGTTVTVGTPHAPQPKPHELPAPPQPALTPQEKTAYRLPPDAPYFWSPDGVPTLPTGYKDPKDASASLGAAMEATHNLVQSIEKARGYVNDANTLIGNTATGLGYNILSHSPVPTDATALNQTVKGEIQGNIFQQWMNSMKAATAEEGGSAFGGRIMQSEIPFIVNSRGALTPGSLTRDQFLGNLDQVEDRVIRSAALLNHENPDDPKVMAKYRQMFIPAANGGNAPPPGASPPNGGGSPDGTSPPGGNDPVKDELTKRLQSGEDPADTIHWLVSIGRPPDKQTIQAIIANRGNQNPDVRGNGILHDLGVGVGGVAQGVGDIANLISTPFTEGVNAIFGTHFNPDMGANLRSALGTPDPQGNGENLAYAINRYGTQALGMASAAKALAARVPGVIGNALETFGNRPLTDAAAGATGGGAAELTRQAGGGPIAQTAAAMAAGVPTIAIGNRVANALSTGARELPSVVSAGQQEGVTVNRAMADKSLQPKVVANGKTMAGAKIMGKEMAQIGDQIGNRVQSAVGDGGTVLSPQDAGNLVAGAGTRYITDTGAQFNRLYGSLQKATEGVKIPATQASQQVDDIISQLSELPNQNAKEISYLQGLKQDLSQPLSIDALRGLRTNLRQTLAKGDLTFGPQEARVQGIADAASQDIANGLQAAGKGDVAQRFRQVDQAYRDRMDMVQNVVQKLTGTRQQNLSGEQVYANLRSMAGPRGNASGLTRMIGQMAPDEQADIRATFANALGKDSSGNFSPAVLARNVNGDTAAGIPRMPQAMRVAIFGEDGAKSLGNLAQLAQEQARVKAALGNSPTALALDAKSLLRNVVFGIIGGGAEGANLTHAAAGAALGAGVTGAKVAANALTARGLMSSKLTGLLRSAPASSDPAAINAWANRLKALAVREPALATEIQSLQDAMVKAANSNVTPAVAASGTEQSN